DRRVQVLLDAGEVDDLIEAALDVGSAHPHDGAVEVDVLPASELGMEAGANFQQRADAAVDNGTSRAGLGDAREHFEQGALAGAVAANDAHGLAVLDLERDVLEGPDRARGRSSAACTTQPA